MTEGKFTQEDAENDGLIIDEAGSELAKQAKQAHPNMWEMFVEMCEEEKALPPEQVLGQTVLRAMASAQGDGQFHTRLSNVHPDITSLNTEEVKKEDMEFVLELGEQLGIGVGEDDDEEDFIDQLVRQRLEAVGGGGMMGLGDMSATGGGANQNKLNKMEKQINKMQSMMEQQVDGDVDDGESADDIFNTDGSEDGDSFDDDEQTDGDEVGDINIDVASDSEGRDVESDFSEDSDGDESNSGLPTTEEADKDE